MLIYNIVNEQEISPKERHNSIGYCSQADILLLENTVAENLTFFAEIKKVPKSKVEREVTFIMEKLKLLPYKNVVCSHLSEGWKRKVSLGIALLNNPKILILDEPTSGSYFYKRRR